jgi:hypothetical protein
VPAASTEQAPPPADEAGTVGETPSTPIAPVDDRLREQVVEVLRRFGKARDLKRPGVTALVERICRLLDIGEAIDASSPEKASSAGTV